jgi:hypothetical protein
VRGQENCRQQGARRGAARLNEQANPKGIASVEVHVAKGRNGRLVFRFPERFFELAVEQLRFGFFRFRAFPEERLTSLRFFFQQLAGLLEVSALRRPRRQLVGDDLLQRGVDTQKTATARASDLKRISA